MKKLLRRIVIIVFLFSGTTLMAQTLQYIPASHPAIQYYGRWDKRDSLRYYHSWPGVYWEARFTGSKIGIRLADSVNYYNVYIDGKFHRVFHGTESGDADYILAENLSPEPHLIRISKRNIVFNAVFSFSGFLLSSEGALLPPPERPERKIEFIGDSFTVGESNEATEQELAWEERFPVTNTDQGFAAMIARHYNAQYHITARSGSGMVCDWQGDRAVALPALFNRTLMETPLPLWEFAQWIPDAVFICLGLNDHSGLRDSNGNISEEKSLLFRKEYHRFLTTLRTVYPRVTLVAVAAFPEWIRKNVRQVVDEEIQMGNRDIFYVTFDEFPGGYVANGHPTVETHAKMAAQILDALEAIPLFQNK